MTAKTTIPAETKSYPTKWTEFLDLFHSEDACREYLEQENIINSSLRTTFIQLPKYLEKLDGMPSNEPVLKIFGGMICDTPGQAGMFRQERHCSNFRKWGDGKAWRWY